MGRGRSGSNRRFDSLQRMETQDGLRAGSGREERRVSTVRARAGGVGGGESYSDADKGRQHIHNPHLWQTDHVARVFPISVAS